jgi:hypothetical protein
MAGDLIPQDWLQNYRDYLRRSLRGKGFADIEFLPEPFAVFQYYRYEAKYPSLDAAAKHCALVIDFGGGTFDICIIETTKEGDIRRGGKNARPLGAASSPIGGFFLNALIAETLYRQVVPQGQAAKIGKGLDLYRRWRKEGDNVLSTAGQEYANFCRRFHHAIHEVEDPKIRICRRITTWAVDAPLSITDRVSLIADPFGSSEDRVVGTLTAEGLRDIFVNQLWPKHLRPVIQKSLTRGKEELGGQPISVVLLSGGSCNIGWLRRLLEADFSYQISGAQIFPIDDYQEVVAKGLAIECARRFYTGEGDFSAVTYNPLYLRLDSDGIGTQTLSFTPKGMVVRRVDMEARGSASHDRGSDVGQCGHGACGGQSPRRSRRYLRGASGATGTEARFRAWTGADARHQTRRGAFGQLSFRVRAERRSPSHACAFYC